VIQKQLSSSSDNEYPVIVAAENYTNLGLQQKLKWTDVLLALQTKTDLLTWMTQITLTVL